MAHLIKESAQQLQHLRRESISGSNSARNSQTNHIAPVKVPRGAKNALGAASKPAIAPSTKNLLQELGQTKRRLSRASNQGSPGNARAQHLPRNWSKPSNTQSGGARVGSHGKSFTQIEQISARSTNLLQGGDDLPIRIQRAKFVKPLAPSLLTPIKKIFSPSPTGFGGT